MSEECLAGCGREALRWRLCEPCGHVLASSCYGKKRFYQRWAATRAMGNSGTHDQQEYRCPVCTYFHTGRLSAGTAGANEKTEQVIRQLRSARNGWLLGWLTDQWSSASRHDRIAWKTRPSTHRAEPI